MKKEKNKLDNLAVNHFHGNVESSIVAKANLNLIATLKTLNQSEIIIPICCTNTIEAIISAINQIYNMFLLCNNYFKKKLHFSKHRYV